MASQFKIFSLAIVFDRVQAKKTLEYLMWIKEQLEVRLFIFPV